MTPRVGCDYTRLAGRSRRDAYYTHPCSGRATVLVDDLDAEAAIFKLLKQTTRPGEVQRADRDKSASLA